MALNDYLPLFLRNVKEFGIINSAFDIENEEIQKAITDFMKENFVKSEIKSCFPFLISAKILYRLKATEFPSPLMPSIFSIRLKP